jgi:hypothetical protein
MVARTGGRKSGGACLLRQGISDVNLFRYCQGVIYFDALRDSGRNWNKGYLTSMCGAADESPAAPRRRAVSRDWIEGVELKNPWEVRPQAEFGDRDPNDLFVAIGKALTEWENVEWSLAELFAVVVSARSKSVFWQPAVQAYGSIVSFNGRCEMLRVAGEAYFSTRKQRAHRADDFKKLVNEAGHYAGRRNEIAHGKVSEVYWYDSRKNAKSHGFYLIPALFNPKKVKKSTGMAYGYVSTDLLHYKQEFTKLHLRIAGFRHGMTNREAAR